MYFERGSEKDVITFEELRTALYDVFDKLGNKNKVLALPPDFTRFHSMAGEVTKYAFEYYREALTDILPTLGTHSAMPDSQIEKMFGNVPKKLFRVHDWRNDVVTVGTVPADFVKKITGGKIDYPWPAQVNKLLVEGNYDLILSIGQVVPHEVIGMANFNKNIFVGTGGYEGINKSHFIGAVYGMEKIMGRADNPVRQVFNYASKNFTKHLPIVYIQTVVATDENNNLVVRGLYIGDDEECFNKAASLSLKVNFRMLDREFKKVVVYLDPHEFKSTWLGNKSVYRTRMAIADGGELIVLAPGVKEFGEDKEIDRLIRKYGYVGSDKVLQAVKENKELQDNLGAAAHLIHGSSEGRFSITYCPGHLTQKEIEGVNFKYADLETMMKRYNPNALKDGWNKTREGEEIYYISNPALGLWAYKEKFK